MNKEKLIELGLTEEQAEKVVKELGGYVPKARFNEVNDEKKRLENIVKERDGQLEDLRTAAGDVEALRGQIATLQAENKAKDDQHAEEIKNIKIDSAVEKALRDAGARNLKVAKALLDLAEPELMEDGTVKGLAEQIEGLKTAEDSNFIFNSKSGDGIKGAEPGQAGDGSPDFSKMTYSQEMAWRAQNPGV